MGCVVCGCVGVCVCGGGGGGLIVEQTLKLLVVRYHDVHAMSQ